MFITIIDITSVKAKITRRHSATFSCLDIVGWNSLRLNMAMDKPLVKAEIMLNVL